MRPGLNLSALGLLFLSSCASLGGRGPAYEPVFQAVDAEADFPVRAPTSVAAIHGYLTVPADRQRPDEGSVQLPVIILKAKKPSGLPPVVRIAGGPGAVGLNAAQYPTAYPWTEERDFIIYDQRGTALAEPALRCPGFREAFGGAEGSETPEVVAAACRAELVRAGIDPGDYHTATIATDLEDLRQALGIETWSLYAGSYGTRVALTYAREYGDALSSMVLDSPLPHTAQYDDESAENFKAALIAVAEDCAAEAPCAEAFPNLGERFFAAIEAANEAPLPYTNEDGSGEADGSDLASIVNLSSADWIPWAPYLMHAIAEGETELFAQFLGGGAGSDFAWGQRMSVWCSEALPYAERRRGKPEDSFAGLESAAVRPEICAAWDVPKRPRREVRATRSDVPTLIIAGAYDPGTPPRYGYEAAATLSRSEVLVIAKGGHMESNNWDGDGCAMKAASAFLASPENYLSGEARPACVDEREPAPFNLPR